MPRLACATAVALFAFASLASAQEALFRYQGKAYGSKDLTPAEQQMLFDIEHERHHRLELFIDDLVLGRYLDARAKKEGKSRQDLEASLLEAPEASDKDAQAWFDANRARLPPQYTFEQVKGEVKQHLRAEAAKANRAALVKTAKKDGDVQLLVAEPKAPIMDVKVEGFPVKGGKDAKVRIVEFADYQCPHCKAASEVLTKVLKSYGDKVSLTYVDFPINPSGVSLVVAHGAVCAEQQGKYWEYHGMAFNQQSSLTKDSPAALAKALSIDETKFKTCMESPAPKARVEAGKAEGERLGVSGTPALFLNGARLHGYDEPSLIQAIDAALKGKSS